MNEPIAIVGIGCRFPGGVTDAKTFWQFLRDGGDAIREIPLDRIDRRHYFDPRPATPGRIMTQWGGFLDDIDRFDADFFGISPREAERMDPQQRLLLETAWEALEDAGQNVQALEGSNTAVYIGQWLSDFEGRLFADPEAVDFYMTTGSGRYAASGRLSYALGLRGPSLTLDTACSSSLAAVHLAVRAIRNGDADMALAGGANVILQPHITIAYSQSRMMAPDGRCKFGDASGDGYVRSEGAAIVALKSLAKAQADGDRIYAVIHGSAVNNDGRSSGSMGTPSRIGQEELLRRAYRDAGVPASRLQYVEAHGTGTRTGDPVELAAIGALVGGEHAEAPVYVGSVKTNIGHTEGAAGVAGLIKVALALYHNEIPASLHHTQPNPAVAWKELGLEVPRARMPWASADSARIAGVSAFGITGTNAHVVLGETPAGATTLTGTGFDTRTPVSPATPASGRAGSASPALLPLSARSSAALRVLAGRYADLLSAQDAPALQDVCWNAAVRRTPLEYRAACVGNRSEVASALRRLAAGEPACPTGTVHETGRPKIAFVLPGQGGQWLGMARELMDREPVFLDVLERCDRAAAPFIAWSIVEQLRTEPDAPGYRLAGIDVIQPVLVAVAIAYAAWLESNGVHPDAVVGHSMGEVAAAYLAGALDLDQAMRVICRRSALMQRTSGQGAMALVELSIDAARARIAGREAELSVAVNNAPRSSVISGRPDAVRAVMDELERDGVFTRLVKVDVASHSPQMDPVARELSAELTDMASRAPTRAIYSTVFGRRVDGDAFGGGYWARNLREPVQFASAVTDLLTDGITVFIELGAHPVLVPSINEIAQARGQTVTTLVCGHRDEPQQADLLSALGAAWCAGTSVDWPALLPGTHAHVALPLYPWQRERHWIDAANARPGGVDVRSTNVRKPDDESLGWLYGLEWEQVESPAVADATAAQWLVAGDDERHSTSLAAVLTGRATSLIDLDTALRESCSHLAVLAGNDADVAYLPVRVLQAVLRSPSRPRLWFVTRGAHALSPNDRVSVEQAALWGAARVVGEEHPDLWGGLVDVASSFGDAVTLGAHLQSTGGEDQVVLRDGRRYALRLAPRKLETGASSINWRPDAAYLITGAFGGAGRHVASVMALQGVRRLILMGRSPLPPRHEWNHLAADAPMADRVAVVRELEAAGVAVHVETVDVGNETQMRGFLDRYASEGWPPIRGVVHMAATLDSHLTVDLQVEAFHAVMAPKLGAAQVLDRLLPDLDLFVMFSSIEGFLAQPGEANYAAANAGLDALAQDRRARGLPATSIAWGVWAGTGLLAGSAGERISSNLARQGVRGFSPEQGGRLFGWLAGRPEIATAVLHIDWAAFRKARIGRGLPLYKHLVADALRNSAGLAERLASATPAERSSLLAVAVRENVAKVLKVAPARIDARRAFGTMGLTSLLALELRNHLEAVIGRSLSATVAWNYPTVEQLVAYLAGTDPLTATVDMPRNAAAATPADLGTIAALSEDSALAALRSSRAKGRR
ncbi:MAG: type I polyketide synthase [Vicinamibacterales bacterium]